MRIEVLNYFDLCAIMYKILKYGTCIIFCAIYNLLITYEKSCIASEYSDKKNIWRINIVLLIKNC